MVKKLKNKEIWIIVGLFYIEISFLIIINPLYTKCFFVSVVLNTILDISK